MLCTVKLPAEAAVNGFVEEPKSTEKVRRMSDYFNLPPLSSIAAPCNGCMSLDSDQGYTSFSEVYKDEFCATSKYPETSLYSAVRSACVRALSGELVPAGMPSKCCVVSSKKKM